MDRIALQILEDGWEQDGRAMRRAVAFVTASLYIEQQIRDNETA
jgi:hypothetical protein